MKVCPNCRNIVEDSAIFCDKCGTRLTAQNNSQVDYSQQLNNKIYTQQSNNFESNQPQYQQPIVVQKTQLEKKNTGMIIGIIAVVLIILSIIGIVAQKNFQDKGFENDTRNDYTTSYDFAINSSSANDDTSSDYNVNTYNKGSVVDGWYVNEWANIRFDTNGGWTEGSAEEYSSYEGDSKTECGIILKDSDNDKQLVICFEKLNEPNVSVTEEEYLDIFTGSLKQQYEDVNITYIVDNYFDTTIAGETFKTAKFSFDGNTMIQTFHVRKCDDYIIFVAIMAQDNTEASSIANNIRTIN